MDDMRLYEVMDLIASYRALAGQAWTMFITVHITVIGGLFLVTKRVTWAERGIAYAIYLAFLWVNFRAQIDYEVLLHRLREEAAYLESQVAFNPVRVTGDIITTAPMSHYLPFLFGAAVILTGLTIAFINRISVKIAVEVHDVDVKELK